jgi:hypothetical protein
MAKIKMALVSLAPVTVAVAGTRIALSATPLEVIQVVIQWEPNNAGSMYIGDSTVASTKGIVLNSSNPSVTLTAEDTLADEDRCVIDLAELYVDAANNGDKVNLAYVAVTEKSYNS